MTARLEARRTTDHDEIKRWAKARGGRPAAMKDTEDGEEGMIRIAFRDDPALEELTWDDFFDRFEEADLVFLYLEKSADGKTSRFFKLVEGEESARAR